MSTFKRLGLLLVVAAIVVGAFGFAPQPAQAQSPEICWGGLFYWGGYWWIIGRYCSPGPDMVAMPSWSVVGTFVENTELNYAPMAGAGTGKVMTIGQTLWVTGMDSTQSWYKVVLSGTFLWVPVSSMAPNFDKVWQGEPLPGEVAP
jgi:hypothetical protein